MNSTFLKSLRLAVVFVLAGSVIALAAWAKPKSASWDDDHINSETLRGTWYVVVTQIDCSTKAPKGPAFPSYLSFAGDATMAENTSNPGFAIGQRGPGLGIWSYEGHRMFSAKSIAFILFSTAGNPPMLPPFKMGTQTITQTITFEDDRDTWSSDATIDFADNASPTPNVYLSGCAVATGTRFK